ncbi:MAG: ATP-binding protein [Candidatus Nanopelagicales bacterium]
MTTEQRRGLGPIGRRLLLAFVLVALSSVVVLSVAAVIGTAKGLDASEDTQRAATATAVAAQAGDAYAVAGGWSGADLGAAEASAAAAGARLVVRDSVGTVVAAPSDEAGMNGMGGMGAMSGRGQVSAPVVVAGQTVGSVRLAFGTPGSSAAQRIAWSWIAVAALAALIVAGAVAWFVTRRITDPLARLADVARRFASGDRAARAAPADVVAPGELGELARSFDATAEAVVVSESTRQAMAADVAHELRTPLAALQAGLEELRDGYVEPDQPRLTALHAQAVRLGRLVDDMAQLSSAEASSLTIVRSPLDLGEVAAEALGARLADLEAAGLQVQRSIATGVWISGDDDRLHQVVGNLLANAAKFGRPGDQVQVAVWATGSRAVLEVADTGPGIAPADLPHVFDRLWRGTADTTTAGSGIGLAVVREVVAAHDGEVDVRSDGRTGTTFTVTLPLIAPPADAP